MIRINLLPFRAARKKENIQRQITIFMLLLFLFAVALFYGNNFFTKKIATLDQEIININHQLTLKMKAAKEVDQIKKDLDELENKTNVIKDIEKNRKEPVLLLDAMTDLIIAKRMWFTDFSDVSNTVMIKGIALDNKTVADFMTRLEKSNLFSTVKLDSLKKEVFKNTLSLKNFVITCQKRTNVTEPEKKAIM
jgi:type IV pilus assembly protein PilN